MTDETAKRFSHVKFGVRTDVGRRRKNNEDAHGEWPEQGFFCVADGMGGAQDGEVASRAVIESLSGLVPGFSKFNPPVSQPDRVHAIAVGVDAASAWIKKYADSQGKKGCGSTFVGVALDPADASKATALHAGDSRVYRVRGRKIVQITRDHSVAEMAGVKDERQLNPMFRSMILRAVGVKSQVETEETPFDLKEGDWVLICSDGLSRMVDDAEIAAICQSAGNPQGAANALVDRANELGGKDNVTVVVFRVGAQQQQGLRSVHARLTPAEMKSLFERGRADGETLSLSTMETTASGELTTTGDTDSGCGANGAANPAPDDESILPDDDEEDAATTAPEPMAPEAPLPAPVPVAPAAAPTEKAQEDASAPKAPAAVNVAAPAPRPAGRGGWKVPALVSVLALAVICAGVCVGQSWNRRRIRLDAEVVARQEQALRERQAAEEKERIAAENARLEREEAERIAAKKAAEEEERNRQLAKENALNAATNALQAAVIEANSVAKAIDADIRGAQDDALGGIERRISKMAGALSAAIDKSREAEGVGETPTFADATNALAQLRDDMAGMLEARRRVIAKEREIASALDAFVAEAGRIVAAAAELKAKAEASQSLEELDGIGAECDALHCRSDKAVNGARLVPGVAERPQFAETCAKIEDATQDLPAFVEKRRKATVERIAAESRERAAKKLAADAEVLRKRASALREKIDAAEEPAAPLETERNAVFRDFDAALAAAEDALPGDDAGLAGAKAVCAEESRKVEAAFANLNDRVVRRNEDARQKAAREAREATAIFPFAEGELPSVAEFQDWVDECGKTIGSLVSLDSNRIGHLRDDVKNGDLEKFTKRAKSFSEDVCTKLKDAGVNEGWLMKTENGRSNDEMFGDIVSGWEKAVQSDSDAETRALVGKCRDAYDACVAGEAGGVVKEVALANALVAMRWLANEHLETFERWLKANGYNGNVGGWKWGDAATPSPKWLGSMSNAARSVAQ